MLKLFKTYSGISPYRKGIIATLMAIICFSTYSIFGKLLLAHIAPHTVAAITQAISTMTILLFFGAFNEFKRVLEMPKKELGMLLIVACLAGAVAPLLFLYGLQTTTASNAVLVESLQPVFLGLLATVFLKEALSKIQLIGMAIMFGGVYVIGTHGFQEGVSLGRGELLITAASLAWATAEILFKKYLHKMTPELMVLMRNLIGTILLFMVSPLLLGLNHDVSAIQGSDIILDFILFSLIVIILAQFLWYEGLELIPATTASSIAISLPLFGVLFAVLVLKESLSLYHLSGGTLILVGLTLTMRHLEQHAPKMLRHALEKGPRQ